jgi:branched-chain amino acid transport system substrate-binding protein
MLKVVVGLSVAVLLTACGSPGASTPTPTQSRVPTGDGVLRIGTVLPATGTFNFLGPGQAAAVATAIKDINAAGGVLGKPVEEIERDSADASTATAEASVDDLVAHDVDAIIGPSSSVLAARLIPRIVDAKVVMISPAATFSSLTVAADEGYFFRTIPPYGQQGTALGEVLSKQGPVKVALVYSNDDLGRSLEPTLAKSLDDAGSLVVASVAFPTAAPDVPTIVKTVREANPDVVVLASAYSSLDATKAFITQLIAAGFGGSKLWLTTQNAGDYSQALPAGLLNGVRGIIEGAHPDDAFIARLKEVTPALGTFRYAAESYDATILAALAAVVAGDDSGEAIAGALEGVSRGGIKCTSFAECLEVLKTQDDIDYDGVSGPSNFTPDGDVAPAFYGLYTFNAENKFDYNSGIVAG